MEKNNDIKATHYVCPTCYILELFSEIICTSPGNGSIEDVDYEDWNN